MTSTVTTDFRHPLLVWWELKAPSSDGADLETAASLRNSFLTSGDPKLGNAMLFVDLEDS